MSTSEDTTVRCRPLGPGTPEHDATVVDERTVATICGPRTQLRVRVDEEREYWVNEDDVAGR